MTTAESSRTILTLEGPPSFFDWEVILSTPNPVVKRKGKGSRKREKEDLDVTGG